MNSTSLSADLRVGLVGLDTSHVVAFTKVLNDPKNPNHVAGARVVAAVKGGSPDVESSASRVDGFTDTLTKDYGIKLVPTVEELCRQVDVVMIESVDGRPHLKQAEPVLRAGKRLFIDKPIGGTLKDAIAIAKLSRETGTPVLSCSSLRFVPEIAALRSQLKGPFRGAISIGPAHLEPHHPDLFWYGVHPAEALFTVMGTGCKTVVRTHTEDTDVVTGVWADGTVGTLRGIRNAKSAYQVIGFSEAGTISITPKVDYQPMLKEIVTFFRTGQPPISIAQTIEIFGFMEAADESKRRGGTPVSVAEVLHANGWDAAH